MYVIVVLREGSTVMLSTVGKPPTQGCSQSLDDEKPQPGSTTGAFRTEGGMGVGRLPSVHSSPYVQQQTYSARGSLVEGKNSIASAE
jgi:hypothetical protein